MSKARVNKDKLNELVALDNITSGVWVEAPSIFRLRLVGTGTITIDSRDRLNVVTTAVETYTISGATNQIEYPYLGEAAVDMRATFPSAVIVEVLA
jgi:hypothetical protein